MPNITHVFVLMLENHSFDNIFAMSGIPGLTVATTANSNSYGTATYPIRSSAPVAMPTDPGHEFLDVFEQLAGAGIIFNPNNQYAPAINNSGFVSNYATSTSEGKQPQAGDIGRVMDCFDTKTQLPVIYELATQFAICDHWFSSMPGPTWPNRFFVHGASSAGLDSSPTDTELAQWETINGFQYPKGSIFDALRKANVPWRLYNDCEDSESDAPQNFGGSIAQVAALKGISLLDVHSISNFKSDLHGSYPYQYTFIEPNYGNILNNSYQGGSSQHPMDDTYGGEMLIKVIYEAIRQSPLWDNSLLIITYDEHGGFYDSVAPPSTQAPGDVSAANNRYNKYGFNFEQLGVRVPAVVISPLIPAGTVDHTVYDHSSICATLERLFGFAALTGRDQNANDLRHLTSLAAARADCPSTLPNPVAHVLRAAAAPSPQQQATTDEQPLPSSGSLRGFLAIAAKTDYEMSARTDIDKAAVVQKHHQIHTRGQARTYVSSVLTRADAVKPAVQK